MPGNSWQTQNNALFFLEPFVLVLLDIFGFVEFFFISMDFGFIFRNNMKLDV